MQYRSTRGITGWGQLGMLIGFTGLGMVLAGLVQVVLGMQLVPSGLPADKMPEAITAAFAKPENVNYARFLQASGTFLMLALPALLCLWIAYGKNLFWAGFNRHISPLQILIGFFLIFLANAIAQPLAELSRSVLTHLPSLNALGQKMETLYNDQVTQLSNLKSWGEFFMALLIMAFFPALFEELFFRGVLQNLLERWWKKPVLALVVTSVVFSLIHMSVFLFLSRMVLGLVLGLMYQQSRNIWVNIVAHFLNNAIALIQLFWLTRHGQRVEADKLDPSIPIWVALAGLFFLVGLFILFYRVSEKNRRQIGFEEQNLLDKSHSPLTIS